MDCACFNKIFLCIIIFFLIFYLFLVKVIIYEFMKYSYPCLILCTKILSLIFDKEKYATHVFIIKLVFILKKNDKYDYSLTIDH